MSEAVEPTTLEALMHYLVTPLVSTPEEIVVTEVSEGDEVKVRLEVAEGDLGRVIGRQGRTIQGLRALLTLAGKQSGHTATLDLID